MKGYSREVRGISVIPTYLMVLVVMVIVGVVAAGVLTGLFLPLGKQKSYPGRAVGYTYSIDPTNGVVTIEIANKRNYDAKVDVILIGTNGEVITTCPQGYVESSLKQGSEQGSSGSQTGGGFSLLAIPVKPEEILTITCYISNVKDVKVFEYGVSSGTTEQAYIGTIPGSFQYTSVSFGLESPWQLNNLYYRLPVTVIVTKSYKPAYVEIKLSSSTLPSDIWSFFKTHVRPDLNDVLVVGVDGIKYPTKGVRNWDGSISVYFKVDKLNPGIYRYYLYFGNPDLDKPVNPLTDKIVSMKLITTPSSLPSTIDSSMAYPSYLIPETNWLPKVDAIMFGTITTKDKSTFDKYVNNIEKGDGSAVKSVIDEALKNQVYYPIGTGDAWRSYSSFKELRPKTDLGYAPWAAVTVVSLPTLSKKAIATGTGVTAKLWVSSDDGSGAYLVALKSANLVYRATIYEDIYKGHGPQYWNYPSKDVPINLDKVDGADMYLVLLVQNGICNWWTCGSGPGYLDFRFAMWWVEQTSSNPPSAKDFQDLYQAYIEVTVQGVGEDLYSYAYPVDLTGRSDVDWSLFQPNTVYVVDSNGKPLYYWVQQEDGKTIVWVSIPYLPAKGSFKFRIYYGGTNKYPEYNNPEKVFAFFDDFSTDPYKSGKWSIYYYSNKPVWDSSNKYMYLIMDKYSTGVAMFMKNIDWRKNFHVHFRVYISGKADGLTFFFFKDPSPYSDYYPTTGGALALDTWEGVRGWVYVVKSPGYAVEFDIYDNGAKDPNTPHVALVETFSSYYVHDNTHYKSITINYLDKWHSVDIYYYNNKLVVMMDGKTLFTYGGGIFSEYGIKYGGIGFSAGTGGLSGVFAIDTVFLRYYPGTEPKATING
jgi:hypothetical protein